MQLNLKQKAKLEARRIVSRYLRRSSRASSGMILALIIGASVTLSKAEISPLDNSSSLRDSIVKSALSLVGTPYRFGGSTTKGFDCCGFVMYVYARNHVAVPRTSREQFEKGRKIDLSAIRKGDLLFYRINSASISHVGIYIGGHQFVHSSVPGSFVRIERIDQEYWEKYFAGAASFL